MNHSHLIMESLMLLGFVGILREATKIFCKDTFLVYILILLFNFFSTEPFIADMLIKQSLLPVTDPRSPDFFLLLTGLNGLERIFFFISIIASLFIATATIIASAMIHGGSSSLSFKDLLFATVTSLKRPFFTWFYTTLLALGYVFLVLANRLPMVLVVQHPVASKVLSIIIVVLAAVLWAYLAVIWHLAFVISVLDDKSGIGALGKAAQIVKGMKLHGFLLNLLFAVLYIVFLQGRLLTIKKSISLIILIGLLLLISICLGKMFMLMAYTVYYYQCKKAHGEEVKLQWNKGYSKGPSLPLLNGNIP